MLYSRPLLWSRTIQGRETVHERKTESCFDSAHFLSPDYDGKRENLHGHRWKVVAYIGVDDLQASGQEKDMVVDFGTFKKALRSLTEELDHTFIVERGSLAPATIAASRIGDVSPVPRRLAHHVGELREVLLRTARRSRTARHPSRRLRDSQQLRHLPSGANDALPIMH